MSVVANPKTDSMRTKASAAAAAAAAVSVGSSFAACGKKNFGPFFRPKGEKKWRKRGSFKSQQQFLRFWPFFFQSHRQFLKFWPFSLGRNGNF